MFDIIVAITPSNGIGLNNSIPWVDMEELLVFKRKTLNSILIMGRKTVENLPFLYGREIYCITTASSINTEKYKNPVKIFNSFQDALSEAKKQNKRIFVAGGAKIYNLVFEKYMKIIDTVHISIMNNEYKCDTFLKYTLHNKHEWVITNNESHENFVHLELVHIQFGEEQYMNLLNKCFTKGIVREGRNGIVKSLFCNHLCFNMQNGFPLLTTKRMFFRGIVEELLFFIRGDTDSKILEDKIVNIWKENTSREFLDENNFKTRKEGIMGPMYGFQWRHFNGEYNEETGRCDVSINTGIDQLKNIIDTIKFDPYSRRIIMTDFNPVQVKMGVLYPCHSIVLQFYVEDEWLDCFCYNRSSDLFLGLPFNIASTALLMLIIAKLTCLTPRNLNISLGDCHIYDSHLLGVIQQLDRKPFKMPTVNITKELKTLTDVENLQYSDFKLENYMSHDVIKAEMVA